MFTFAQLVSLIVIQALWIIAAYIAGYFMGRGDKATAQPFAMPSIPDWISEALPEKRKPPDDETLNPTWQ